MKYLLPVIVLAMLTACGSDPKKPSRPATDPSTVKMQEDSKADVPKTEKPVTVKPEKEISHESAPNPAAENKVISMILDLPEVKKMSNEIRRKTKGTHKLKVYVSDTPSDDQEYYTVVVAEDNGGSLVSMENFRVYPDNSITYYSVAKDIEMSLKDWRSLRE